MTQYTQTIKETLYPEINSLIPSEYMWPEGPDKHVIKWHYDEIAEEYDIINGERCEWVAEVNNCYTYMCINEWLPEANRHATYSLGYASPGMHGGFKADYRDMMTHGRIIKIGDYDTVEEAKAAVVDKIRRINNEWNRAGRPKSSRP